MGSVKAQAYQGEVDKLLGKGALELAGISSPGYYSCLFLVQEALRGRVEISDRSFKSEWICHLHQVHDGDGHFSIGVDQKDVMFTVELKDAYF